MDTIKAKQLGKMSRKQGNEKGVDEFVGKYHITKYFVCTWF